MADFAPHMAVERGRSGLPVRVARAFPEGVGSKNHRFLKALLIMVFVCAATAMIGMGFAVMNAKAPILDATTQNGASGRRVESGLAQQTPAPVTAQGSINHGVVAAEHTQPMATPTEEPVSGAQAQAQAQAEGEAEAEAEAVAVAALEADANAVANDADADAEATADTVADVEAIFQVELEANDMVPPSEEGESDWADPKPGKMVLDGFVRRWSEFDDSVSRDKGIIISLNDKVMSMGLSLIRDLRCRGNGELIQVYHCLPDELTVVSQFMLLSHDNRLEIIDVCSDFLERGDMDRELANKFKNWWVKPLALYHTDLQQPLLMDADVLLMRDPAVIRDAKGYVQNGTMFFYDRVIRDNILLNFQAGEPGKKSYLKTLLATFEYEKFGIEQTSPSEHLMRSFVYNRRTCHEMDSSMVAVDKRRTGKAMDVLWWLITKERIRFDFSYGDKESFWLAFELARQPYAFSPWGVSVVSSSANEDMRHHPDTLCGSIAHYMPIEDEEPELLYVNGRALLEPIPQGVGHPSPKANNMYNINPTHVTPRLPRTRNKPSKFSPHNKDKSKKFPPECLVGLGSTRISSNFAQSLLRRRIYFLGITMDVQSAWNDCAQF